MLKKYIKTGILLIVLGVPVFVFLFLKFFGENKFDLPHYFPELDASGEVKVVKGDTVFIKAPDFQLKDKNGEVYFYKKGEISVVSFFFSRCGTICPITNKNLLRVAENFKSDSLVRILSLTVDPVFDTSEVLNKYALELGANYENWVFLTGDKKYIYDLAIKGFKLPVSDASDYDKNIVDIDQTFIHSDKLLLIDKFGHIRGIYEGTNKSEIERLVVEIKVLLKDK
ncbi:MAG: SCO family protein [Cytophagaceae bacterium BCCC1]|nr:MAG: SCO family protein [Cytophagaceae bacterium BCCC1]